MMKVTLTLLAVAVVSASTYTKSDQQERAQVRQDIDGDNHGASGGGGRYAGIGSPERGTFAAFGIGRGSYGDRVVSSSINEGGSSEGRDSLGDSSEGGRRERVYPSSLGQGSSRGGGLLGARIGGSSSEEISSEGARLARVLFGQGSYGGGGQRGAGTGGSSSEKGSFEDDKLVGVLIDRGSSEEKGLRRAGRRFRRVRFGVGSSEGSSSESDSSESESSEEGRRGGGIKIERLVGGRVGGGSFGSGSFEGGGFRGSGSFEGDSDEGGRVITRGGNRPHAQRVAVSVEVFFNNVRVPVAYPAKDSVEVIKVVSAPVNKHRGGYY